MWTSKSSRIFYICRRYLVLATRATQAITSLLFVFIYGYRQSAVTAHGQNGNDQYSSIYTLACAGKTKAYCSASVCCLFFRGTVAMALLTMGATASTVHPKETPTESSRGIFAMYLRCANNYTIVPVATLSLHGLLIAFSLCLSHVIRQTPKDIRD
ncbi:hypothetical protein BX070DRAFT_153852 [Coemansia spiralis]|nr:hypothetical protein BX070DRAFT_153852 [Coemansia spiralis]